MKRKSRVVSLLLCAVVALALMPGAAFAEGVSVAAPNASDIVYFGNYPQSDLGTVQPAGTEGVDWEAVDVTDPGSGNTSKHYYKIEPIAWRVLSNANGELLLFAQDGLDAYPYHDHPTIPLLSWVNSRLRTWLNATSGFVDKAFSSTRFSTIKKTAVEDFDNPYDDASIENFVFLLSLEDTTNISYGFSDSFDVTPPDNGGRAARPTEYAKAKGVRDYGGSCDWWLRDIGVNEEEDEDGVFSPEFAAYVKADGNIDDEGADVKSASIAIRPAITLKLNSVIFVSEYGQTTAIPKSDIPNPTITTEAKLPEGWVGDPYRVALTAISAYGLPVTWSVSEGTLPGGLTLDANTGIISGTPTSNGAAFQIKADNGASVKKSFALVINPLPGPIDDILGAKTPIWVGVKTRLPKSIDFGDGTKDYVTWTSGNPSVATVDAEGNLDAVGEGKATITATANSGKTQTVTITVAKLVKAVRTPLTKIYLKKGTSFTPPVCADSSTNGKDDINALLTWTSSKPKIAAVDTATGKIKAKKAGTAKITATTLNGKAITFTVKVLGKATALKKVAFTKPPKSLAVGKTEILKVKTTPSTATNLKVTFSSSDKKVLTVDKAGKLTALKKGKAKITVKIGKKKYVKAITVK